MTITEIDVDNRGRASLRSTGMEPGRYRVSQVADAFKFEPVKSHTDAELMALSDPHVIAAHQAIQTTPERYTSADDLP